MNDDRVYILDVYNRGIYPHDGFAKRKLYNSGERSYYHDYCENRLSVDDFVIFQVNFNLVGQ